MQEMQALQGNRMDDFPMSYNVVVNTNHPLISGKLLAASAESREELASYLYQVALLSQNLLKGEALTNFVRQSLKMAE